MTDDCLPLPALTFGEVASLLPVHYVTVARWRDGTAPNGFPDPDFVPAGNPKRALWSVGTITVWADSRGIVLDEAKLAQICQTKTVE